MNKILSWKIDSSTYAYIYVPNSTTYITNRIPEDSPLWSSIIYEISGWDYDTYYSNFQKMSKEVNEKYGIVIPWDELYWNFVDENSIGNVNIVLLAGKDGDGSGNGGNGGNGAGSGDGAEVYEELRDAINKELDKAKKDIEEQNKRVEEFVEEKVGETIAEAKNTIAETKKELAETRAELEKKLEGAAEALDKAAALFDMGEGGITGEQIQDVLNSVNEHNKWITSHSGTIVDFKTDYDAAERILGGIGSAEDALAGLFSQIGTTVNDMNNTVGNVERWMVASAATIGDIATWYDVNVSAVTEASSIINASAGTITDAINFISGDGLTTKVTSIMDGRNASIKDEIMTETSAAVTNVKNELNGLSGIVETSITRLDNIDGDLVSLGKRMNAEEEKMEQWMNVSDSAMSLSHDLRDTWSIASGKLSTVANLTAETDEKGEIMYFVSGATGNEIRVTKNLNGKWLDASGYEYNEERVYVHWSQAIGSYIQQQASSITMSVMNSSGLTAAIKLAIERGESGEDESVIKMVSDRLIITGDMIAQAISANTANIGGIHMGMGQVWSEATNPDSTPKFRLDGVNGTLYATNAEIKGKIRATELILDDSNQDIGVYVQEVVGEKCVILDRTFGNGDINDSATTTVKISRNGLLQANNAIINGTIFAQAGEIGGFSLARNILSTYDPSDLSNPIAILNGSDTYKDDVRGKLILGAGINPEKGFHTRIYSNGEIYTGMINIESGYFNGDIRAGGYFWGELSGATGSLNGITLNNCRINGNIHLNADSSFKMNSVTKTYFNADVNTLSNSSNETWTVDSIDKWWENANGTDAGQTYKSTITVSNFSYDKDATITVPSITASVSRNSSPNHTSKASSITFKCVCKEGGSEKVLINQTRSIASIYDNDSTQTVNINIPSSSYTTTTAGTLVYTVSYNIHLATYGGIFFKRANCSVKFNTSNKKITVKYPTLPNCVSVAPNGLRVITNRGMKVAILDYETEITSANDLYGLKVSNDGIKIRRNSKSQDDWVDL
jgi:hypothetical protein